MIPSVASAPKPTQGCETHTVWQWSYGSSRRAAFRMPSKDEYRNFLPAHVWRYSISASNCGSTRDADPQPFLSRERKPSESPWLKARMMSKLLFLVRVFRGHP